MDKREIGIKRFEEAKVIDPNGYEEPYKIHCKIHNVNPDDPNERKIYDESIIVMYSNMSDETYRVYLSIMRSNSKYDLPDSNKDQIKSMIGEIIRDINL